MGHDSRYGEPFFWWGPSGAVCDPASISDLLRDGTIDPGSAAVLWAALARGKSLAVVAGPSGAGKTTLLTALLAFLPPDNRRLYLRGNFETFAFLDDAAVVPAETALLVNEISPHLPVYLWGSAVERSLRAAEAGFSLLGTAHATTVSEFVGMLTGSPLRVPAALVAAFEFVALLEPTIDAPSGRRVSGIWRLRPTRDGVRIDPVGVAVPFLTLELNRRAGILAALRDGEVDVLPTFHPVPTAASVGSHP